MKEDLEDGEPIHRYFVYKNDNNLTGGESFGCLESALVFCDENDGDMIECLSWDDYDSYVYNTADDYYVVWRNGHFV